MRDLFQHSVTRQPVPLFVELCAGTAALSLRLHAAKARPPVSRMGAKTGYADAILRVLGLRPGQRADRYLWCEPDAGVRLLLHAYRDRELAKAAAGIIRGWADEEPRALWERLRAEGPAQCPPVDAREVARFMQLEGYTRRNGLFDRIMAGGKPPTSSSRWDWAPKRDWIARRAIEMPTLPATIADDARKVDPREVARWLRLASSNRLINLCPATWQNTGAGGSTFGGDTFCTPIDKLARSVEATSEIQVAQMLDSAIEPACSLPPGTVAYLDPPYVGTTPYAHDLPRSEVVRLSLAWAAAGATVAISEAEPLPELLALGWHQQEITWTRKGQKRTFSRQQREFLTMNRKPRHPGAPARPLLQRKRGKVL
jgi:hypothetical protein